MQNKKLKKMGVNNNKLLICEEFPLRDFPGMLVEYLSQGGPPYSFMETHFSLEERGKKWRTRGLGNDNVKKFIYKVCRWGGGARLIPRIKKGNTPAR